MEIDRDSRLNQELGFERREHARTERRVKDVQRPRYAVVTKAMIGCMRVLNNMVLCRVPRGDDDYVEVNGMRIQTRYREIEWMPTYLEVVGVPDRLSAVRIGDDRHDLEAVVDMEVSPGDRVLCRYLAVMKALKWADAKGSHACVYCADDKSMYVMVPYKDLVCRIRSANHPPLVEADDLYAGIEHEVYALNGWVVMEKVESECDMMGLSGGATHSTLFGRIKYVGQKVRSYYYDYSPDTGGFGVGDVVAYSRGGHIELAERGVSILGKGLFRCPVRHVQCVVNPDHIESSRYR